MASLSLPKVLQQRKTSLEIERENFEKFQAISLSKAINQLETPVKEKHVRQAIIGTFQEKGAQTFWTVVLRLPLQENRIVAWKFCHVLHKILREGHPNSIPRSQRYRGKIDDLGKLWVHLREGYGKLIHLYCALLKTKLDFHRRNPRFPGNLILTEKLEAIGENDINIYFQLCVEMFDYMDDVLALQSAIFGSLDMSRSNSMTSSGQCRVAPLIPCIQDAAPLYDYSVKILFKLHSALPPDILDGHRKRFLTQFTELKQFYQNSCTLQYFRNLISIPSLPENPPNFLIQAELRTYVTPVVVLPPEPEPEPEPLIEGSLIDTSDVPDSTDTGSRNGSISPVGSAQFVESLAERDALIAHLHQELGRLRQEMQAIIHEQKAKINVLQERITLLETELATRESELVQERQLKEDLFHQASAVAQSQDSEQKTKEEKFNILKDVYTKLREEHIQLIRQKAEVEKQLRTSKKNIVELEEQKKELDIQVQNLNIEKDKEIENVQHSIKEQIQELEVLQAQHDYLKSENKNLNAKVDWVVKEKENLEYQLKELLEQKENLDRRLKTVNEHFQELDRNLDKERKSHMERIKSIIDKIISEIEALLNNAIHEIDNPALSATTCGPDYFKSLITNITNDLHELTNIVEIKLSNPEQFTQIIIQIGHKFTNLLIHGKATSNTARNIMLGEQMEQKCKKLGEDVIKLLRLIKSDEGIESMMETVKMHLNTISELVDVLSGQLKGDSADTLADLVEDELTQMDKAIEEAAKRIEEMLNKSRAADSGVKLEVNEKILDSCTTLMQAIRILVQKSKLLQAEIVAQGKGTSSTKEFYKRNHRWTEGLISAAKAVGLGAKFLLSAADQVVSGQGKFEHLVVGAQEIAASTAQLVVASRVKAERNSSNLVALTDASKAVTSATGGVVATSKACSQLIEESDLDMSGLSLHAAKRLEMEAQVRVLELEQSLEKERLRLSALRRHHYQLAGEQEGWDIIDKEEN